MRHFLYLAAFASLAAGAASAQTTTSLPSLPGLPPLPGAPRPAVAPQHFAPAPPMPEPFKPYHGVNVDADGPFSAAAQERRIRQQAKPMQGAFSPEAQARRDRAEARRAAAAASPY